ncbi:MAG: hypothetical protein EAZ99_14445 [Alphaproteobacteria bacterium]|nr:hypothetical protein [Alphaproteobacteria bacterium]TAD88240.1 MAG: hypothetical protein EAZ99_14445 [Alphaproteobacteria bacterium]
MAVIDQALAEVIALHQLFEGWLGGTLPRDPEVFQRCAASLAPDFTQIDPEGRWQPRDPLLARLAAAHGIHRDADQPFLIEIRAAAPRVSAGDLVAVTYEEHQRIRGVWRARLSTALFTADPTAPEGVLWRHLQETWVPDPAVTHRSS